MFQVKTLLGFLRSMVAQALSMYLDKEVALRKKMLFMQMDLKAISPEPCT